MRMQAHQQSDDGVQQQQPTTANDASAAAASSASATKTTAVRASIGVNLRVTGHCQQGGRRYMEDYFAVAYQQTEDEKDLEYAFFGIFDGHGGAEAAAFAKEHLMEFIVKDARFWCDDDQEVLQSIKDGFIETHHAMWKIHETWPKTAAGLPSTAGTTASIAFIRRGKIYVGHVGDSGITLGHHAPGRCDWQARALTKDHKPECEVELARIEQSGGKVISKMGVPRVVWNRPRIGHKGPVRRSTPIDEIPFLAVARSLGDLWSYNASNSAFVVSPEPDVAVIPIDTATFRCLIFGTDGLYNMLSPAMAVHIVQEAERRNEEAVLSMAQPVWVNPSKALVERALDRWCHTKIRADNTSVITLMLDPPGPPRAQVLKAQRLERQKQMTPVTVTMSTPVAPPSPKVLEDVDRNFMPKSRESTAFDTRIPTPINTPDTPANSGEEEDSDVQINEVSSSFDEKKKKKKQKPAKKMNMIQRKFNLRSGSSTSNDAVAGGGGAGGKSDQKENVPESRVLRERRTPAADHPQQTSTTSGKVFKRKSALRKKLTISAEKKKLLQTLLFKKDVHKSESCTTTTTTTTAITASTSVVAAAVAKTKEKTPPSIVGRRSERHRTASPQQQREMRKSTLLQQQQQQQQKVTTVRTTTLTKIASRSTTMAAAAAAAASTTNMRLKRRARGLLKAYARGS